MQFSTHSCPHICFLEVEPETLLEGAMHSRLYLLKWKKRNEDSGSVLLNPDLAASPTQSSSRAAKSVWGIWGASSQGKWAAAKSHWFLCLCSERTAIPDAKCPSSGYFFIHSLANEACKTAATLTVAGYSWLTFPSQKYSLRFSANDVKIYTYTHVKGVQIVTL